MARNLRSMWFHVNRILNPLQNLVAQKTVGYLCGLCVLCVEMGH
jgi:hypothetical protein